MPASRTAATWRWPYGTLVTPSARCSLAARRSRSRGRSITLSASNTRCITQPGFINSVGLGDETEALGEEQIRIATEEGFPFWQATGTLYRASGLLLRGKLVRGLALLENGLDAYRATGAELGLPYYFGLLAEACLQAGRFSDARRALDDAAAVVESNDEHFYEAELQRLRGELWLAESDDEAGGAGMFSAGDRDRAAAGEPGLRIASRDQSRAAWAREGAPEAYGALTAVFEKFTEGSGTPDLADAASLLREFSNDRMRNDFAAGVEYVRACIPPPMQGKSLNRLALHPFIDARRRHHRLSLD